MTDVNQQQYPHMAETSTVLLTDTTLEQIVASGNAMADKGQRLEKQIWALRAESIRQLRQIAGQFAAADPNDGQFETLFEQLRQAGDRVQLLSKLWNSAKALSNRANQFADINCGPEWLQLSEVFAHREKA